MQIEQLTIHSSFQNHKLNQTKSFYNYSLIMKPLLYGAAFFFISFFFSFSSQGAIRMAVIDTGFCVEKMTINKKIKNQITILPVIDVTSKNKWNCKKVVEKQILESPRFHGQRVLQEFLKFAPKKEKVIIKPIVIFDQKGNQTKEAWLKAIRTIEKEKIDYILTASGMPVKEKINIDLPGIWFVPSGRIERTIKKDTMLFPQLLGPQVNLFIIGDYSEGKVVFYDQDLLYKDVIDYYFPIGKGKFKGTSRAVAEAMGVALSSCPYTKNELSPPHALRLCLMKKSKVLNDPIAKIDFKTFH